MPNVSNIYDLIVPLGYACSCSQALRRAELQLASFPWDWIGVPPPSERCRMICEGFRDFMNLEDLKWIGVNDTYGHEEVLNTRNGLIILHDFVSTAPLGEQYPLVASKYARRIERLDRCLRAAKRVLLVCIDAPVTPVPTPPEDCRRAIDEMSAKYPNAKFDFLLMNLEHGRARAEMIDETPVEGVRRVAFDYKCHIPGTPAYGVEIDLLADFLRSEYGVNDYRTKEELAAYRKSRRRKRRQKLMRKMDKLGAKNIWQFMFLRIKAKIQDAIRGRSANEKI